MVGVTAARMNALKPAYEALRTRGIPPGYRSWQAISVAQEAGELDSLRIILGNPIAIAAYQDGTLPFPDGSELVKIARKWVPSAESEGAFIPGEAQTVHVMVKDANKYASTGGWGFGRFIGGKPVDLAQHQTCFGWHAAKVKDHDSVFTRLPHW